MTHDADTERELRRTLSDPEITGLSFTHSWWFGMAKYPMRGHEVVRLNRSEGAVRAAVEILVEGLFDHALATCRRERALSTNLLAGLPDALRTAPISYGYADSQTNDAGSEHHVEIQFAGNNRVALNTCDGASDFWACPDFGMREPPEEFAPNSKQLGITSSALSQVLLHLDEVLRVRQQSERLCRSLEEWATQHGTGRFEE